MAGLSYNSIYNDRKMFLRAGGSESGPYNFTDDPGHYYFKLMFYFDDENSHNGLLGCPWLNDNLYSKGSAYTYLGNNDEIKRQVLLKDFITLLSDINAYAPWTFQKITGLDEALNRKYLTGRDFKLDEERKSITIECLEDSVDTRVGTLLDLYRAITYSNVMKREILPANLRKFNMGLFIFQAPIHTLTTNSVKYDISTTKNTQDKFESGDKSIMPSVANSDDQTKFQLSSSKYIEFRNCEIDYNSSVAGYSEVNNIEGVEIKHKIKINFDDVYESRWNEYIAESIGDFIATDFLASEPTYTDPTNEKNTKIEKLSKLLNYYNSTEGISDDSDYTTILKESNPNKYNVKFQNGRSTETLTDWPGSKTNTTGVVSQLVGAVDNRVSTLVKSAYLGNMYGLSVRDIGQTIAGGNIFTIAKEASNVASKVLVTTKEIKRLSGHSPYDPVKRATLAKINQIKNLRNSI